MLWTVAVLVLWESIGTTFSLLPAVASRDEYKLLPRVSTDFLLGFCHCWGDTEPGMAVFYRGGWWPTVCRSEMTWGLILLAVAHLSATLAESREFTEKEIQHLIPERGVSVWLAASPYRPEWFRFHKTQWNGRDSRPTGLLLFFSSLLTPHLEM